MPNLTATLFNSGMLTTWAELGVCSDTSACGDQLTVARAQIALLGGRGGYDAAIEVLSTHHFAHYQHGRRPELTGLWLDAQVTSTQCVVMSKQLCSAARRRQDFMVVTHMTTCSRPAHRL
jgi:hypothetical protein